MTNPVTRAVSYLCAWFFLQAPVEFAIDMFFANGGHPRSGPLVDFRLTQYISQAVVVALVTWGARKYWDRARLVDLGFAWNGEALREMCSGLLIGGIGMGALAAAELASDWLKIFGLAPNFLAAPGRGIFIMALMAWSEETVFRGYLLHNLEKAWGPVAAFLGTSVLFGLLHLPATDYTGTNLLLVFLSMTLASFVFTTAYYVRRTLWLPIGLHFGWDLTQIGLGADSGAVMGGPILFDWQLCGPVQWVGCHAGTEVGLLGWFAMLLMLFLIQGYAAWRSKARVHAE